MSSHFNMGNSYAVKPVEKVASVAINKRVTPATKERWSRQSITEGLSLSAWMQRHLDAVCDASDKPDFVIFRCDDCGGMMVDEHESRCHCCGDKGTWTAIPVMRSINK